MRTPDYYGNVDKTRDKAAEILDRSGLAYFVAISEKSDKKNAYHITHGKVGEGHQSYELVVKATVHALSLYSKEKQIYWLKFIGKKLGFDVEVKDGNTKDSKLQ